MYVNGVLCGFEKNPFVRFQIDVTPGIRAGQVNEIWVGIRDAYYGRSADPQRPLKLRKTFNIPLKYFGDGFQDLDYPVWNAPQSGILSTPTLVAAGGSVYTADVFVKPSVANKRLDAEITLRNTSAKDAAGEIRWEAVDEKTGTVEHTFPPAPIRVPAGKTQVLNVSGAWENPKLWWPDSPHLYRLANNGRRRRQTGRRQGYDIRLSRVADRGDQVHAQRRRLAHVGRSGGRPVQPRSLAGSLPAHQPAYDAHEHCRPGEPRFALAGDGAPQGTGVLRSQRRGRAAELHAGRRGDRQQLQRKRSRSHASNRADRT